MTAEAPWVWEALDVTDQEIPATDVRLCVRRPWQVLEYLGYALRRRQTITATMFVRWAGQTTEQGYALWDSLERLGDGVWEGLWDPSRGRYRAVRWVGETTMTFAMTRDMGCVVLTPKKETEVLPTALSLPPRSADESTEVVPLPPLPDGEHPVPP